MKDVKHLTKSVAVSALVAVAILLLSWTSYFIQITDLAYDFTLRAAGEVAPTSPTLIVAIDEESLERFGPWPWPRDRLAQVVERIESDSPRVIAVDFLLDDQTSAAGDAALARAIAKSRSVVLATRIDRVEDSHRWRKPFGAFEQRHVRLGHVHADPDLDGINRRILSVKEAKGAVVPAFALECLRGAGFPIGERFEQTVGLARRVRAESLMIRFVGDHHSFQHVAAWEVLEGLVKPELFKGRIVLIGATAEGLGDHWLTPWSVEGRGMSGVEIHANAIDTIYAERAIRQVPDVVVLLGLLAMILCLMGLDRRFEGKRFYASALLLIPTAVLLSWLFMKYSHTWFPFPPLFAAVVLVVPALGVGKLMRVNRDLDAKIQRLSVWDEGVERRGDGATGRWKDGEMRERILAELPPGPERDGWIAALDAYEKEAAERASNRNRLLASPRRNARWKLDAIDFFNDQLYRFLSFNNAILASIEDVIVVSDPTGRVAYQNPAARRMEGFSEDPSFAPDYVSFLLDGRKILNTFAAVLARQEPLTLEFVPAQNGKHFYNVTLAPIARIGVVISMHDVTAQRELNQAKNDMVSLVSHELRTPLTSIQGYSDMLQKYDLVEGNGKQFLEVISAESRRLNQLIQSFLDIAYIESGRQKINISEFDVRAVVDDLMAMMGPVAEEKKIRLEADVEPDSTRVRADRMLLYQALSNLVTNAIKYSPTGTTVRVEVANGTGQVQFRVVDQGYGIPAEDAAKVFEKFYRRGNKETREQSGFGLGLAFVREVATKHGGDVTMESELGKGTVFSLWIPN